MNSSLIDCSNSSGSISILETDNSDNWFAQEFISQLLQQQWYDAIQNININNSRELNLCSFPTTLPLINSEQKFLLQTNEKTDDVDSFKVTKDDQSRKCADCHARTTPLWRKGLNNKILCNKCGLRLKRRLEREKRNSKIVQFALS